MGNLCAQTGELAGSLEEFYDLLQLLLFLVRACNVLEQNLILFIGHRGFDARLAEVVDLVALAAGTLHRNHVQHYKHYGDQNKGQVGDPAGEHQNRLMDDLLDQSLLGKLHNGGSEIALEVFHIGDLVEIGCTVIGGIGECIFTVTDHAALDTLVKSAVPVRILGGVTEVGKHLAVILQLDDLLGAASLEQEGHHNAYQCNEDRVKKDHLQIILHSKPPFCGIRLYREISICITSKFQT